MCGIIGYIGDKKATPVLINGLLCLEYRGYDSAGIAVIEDGKITVMKDKGRVANLEAIDGINDLKSTIGIAHTRWATHGKPAKENSHPHMDNSGEFAVVHNGIIENYHELKEFLASKGYYFLSQTDTEIIPNLIHYYYTNGINDDDKFLRAVKSAVDDLKGSYALEIISNLHPDRVIVVRKDSPLVLGKGNSENFIASDIPAVLKYTKEFYLLDDQEYAVVYKDHIDFYDNSLTSHSKAIKNIEWDATAAEKNGYEDYMLKEIFEQPTAIRETIGSRFKLGEKCSFDDIDISKEYLEKINKIYIVACGTAMHAGLVGKNAIEKLCKIPTVVDIASEFRYRDPIIDDKTLCIYISQSGETADTLAAMRLAQSKGARVLGVVNAVGSSIAREADDVLYTLAGPEIAVASTKAFSAQVVAMYLLTLHIAQELNKISPEEFAKIKAALEELPSLVNNILTKAAPAIEKFTQKYIHSKNVFYIGRGLDYIVGMEGSLKLKEIAYLHSEPYAAGELKHGPIALIEDSTLVVGIVTQEDLFEKTVSNIREVKARGAKVLAIAMSGNTEIEKYADDVIYIPRTHWMLTSLLANIPQQLFAYYMARDLGISSPTTI